MMDWSEELHATWRISNLAAHVTSCHLYGTSKLDVEPSCKWASRASLAGDVRSDQKRPVGIAA